MASLSLPSSARRITVLLLATLLSTAGLARDRGDHERARDAVQSGQILPLRSVLERLEREQAGQVLEIELDDDDRRWIYKVKLLQADGQLMRLYVDAGTGEVLGRRVGSRHRSKEDDR